MGTLTVKDVEHVAKLANLKLTKAEVKKFQKQLSSVLDYFNQLKEVDTSEVELLKKEVGLINITREDQAHPEYQLSQEAVLSGTDKTDRGYFKIPLLVEKKR